VAIRTDRPEDGSPASQTGEPPAPANKPPKPALAATRALAAIRGELAAGAPDPAPRARAIARPTTPTWEANVLRPDVLARDLDLQATRLTGEVQDVLQQIDAELERQVTAFAGRGASALAGSVRTIAVPEVCGCSCARSCSPRRARTRLRRRRGPRGDQAADRARRHRSRTRAPAYPSASWLLSPRDRADPPAR
jgi:hypothetical protein